MSFPHLYPTILENDVLLCSYHTNYHISMFFRGQLAVKVAQILFLFFFFKPPTCKGEVLNFLTP